MKNFIQDGDTFDHTVTVGEATINPGDVVISGQLKGIAKTGAVYSATDPGQVTVKTTGVYRLAKDAPLVITKGDKVYWNTTDKEITKTVGDVFLGYAWESAASSDTTVDVKVAGNENDAPKATVVAALTGTLTGTANGSMVDVAAAAAVTAGGATPTAAEVDAGIATAVAPIVTGVNEQLKELQTKYNELLTVVKAAGLMATS